MRNAGVWTYQTVLVGSGAIGNAQQGVSVALSGDGNTAVIGGCYDNTYKGAIWIWTRSGTTWTQQGSKLVGSGAVGSLPQQGFSVSRSTDGNTVAEAGSGDGPTYDQGAIWVWTRSGSTWTQQGSKIVGSGYLRSQQGSVALSGNGNTLIIGGYTAGTNNQGAIWFFTRSGGVWTQQAGPLTGTVSATGQYHLSYAPLRLAV